MLYRSHGEAHDLAIHPGLLWLTYIFPPVSSSAIRPSRSFVVLARKSLSSDRGPVAPVARASMAATVGGGPSDQMLVPCPAQVLGLSGVPKASSMALSSCFSDTMNSLACMYSVCRASWRSLVLAASSSKCLAVFSASRSSRFGSGSWPWDWESSNSCVMVGDVNLTSSRSSSKSCSLRFRLRTLSCRACLCVSSLRAFRARRPSLRFLLRNSAALARFSFRCAWAGLDEPGRVWASFVAA